MARKELGMQIEYLLAGNDEITVYLPVEATSQEGKDVYLRVADRRKVEKEYVTDSGVGEGKGTSIKFREAGDAIVQNFAGSLRGDYIAPETHVVPGLTRDKALIVLTDATLQSTPLSLDFRDKEVEEAKKRLAKIVPRLAGLIT
jgi:hypothetical protein